MILFLEYETEKTWSSHVITAQSSLSLSPQTGHRLEEPDTCKYHCVAMSWLITEYGYTIYPISELSLVCVGYRINTASKYIIKHNTQHIYDNMYLCIYVYMYNIYIYILYRSHHIRRSSHIPSPKASAQVTQSSFWEKVTEVALRLFWRRNPCENHGKTMGKPWENHGKMVV